MLCKADAPMVKGRTSAMWRSHYSTIASPQQGGGWGGGTGIIEGVSPQYMRCRKVSRLTAIVSAEVLPDSNGRMR